MSCDCTGQCRKPPFTCNGLPVAVRAVVEWLFMSEAPSVEGPATIARLTAELVEARERERVLRADLEAARSVFGRIAKSTSLEYCQSAARTSIEFIDDTLAARALAPRP